MWVFMQLMQHISYHNSMVVLHMLHTLEFLHMEIVCNHDTIPLKCCGLYALLPVVAV